MNCSCVPWKPNIDVSFVLVAHVNNSPCHSRVSSTGLFDMQECLLSPPCSLSHTDSHAETADEMQVRDRSTTWSANSRDTKPDMGRKMSEPLMSDCPTLASFKPSSLATVFRPCTVHTFHSLVIYHPPKLNNCITFWSFSCNLYKKTKHFIVELPIDMLKFF